MENIFELMRKVIKQGIFFIFLFLRPTLSSAAQKAIVIREKAVIYADKYMTSPIGFISKGKKISVASNPKNKGLVYPVVVTGKMAYIRARDLSLEREIHDSQHLVMERFQKLAKMKTHFKWAIGYQQVQSQISIKHKDNLGIFDGDVLIFQGLFLSLEQKASNSMDLQLLTQYYLTSQQKEKIDLLKVGFGASYRIFDFDKFLLKFAGHFFYIPYSSYSYENDLKVNARGISLGGGPSMIWFFSKSIGVEATLGYYFTDIGEYQVPAPYNKIDPSFKEVKMGLGLNYRF